MQLEDSYEGLLNTIVSQLGIAVSSVINEISNPSKIPLSKLIDALDSDPVAYACCQIKSARVLQILSGEYKHENEEITSLINTNLENIGTNISELAGRLSSAMPVGMALAEVSFKKWKIKDFNVLNPANVTFNVRHGNVEDIKYNDGGVEKNLPTWKALHITNGLMTNFGSKLVFGSPEMRRAYPYIRLKQLLFGEIGITAKRLATGFLVGSVDSNVDTIVTDSKGAPVIENGRQKRISAAEQMAKQLAKLENNGYVIIDKRNTVQAQGVPAGEQFWNLVSMMIDTQLMRCFVIPDTIFQQGVASFGVGGLANMQLNILDSSVQEIAKQIKEELLEKAIKPVILFNKGKQKDYGNFESIDTEDPNKQNMQIQTLMSLMSMQLIPNTDVDAINLLRTYIGLPKITEEEQQLQTAVNNQLQSLDTANAQQQEAYPEDFTENVQEQQT